MRRAVIAVALFAAFCAPGEPKKKSPPAPARAAAQNLLSLNAGAAVVSRTAEAMLDASAVRAIDTDLHTMWVSPPGDPQQTLVFSLPARARIDQVGLRGGSKAELLASAIRVDVSVDGQNFATVATVKPVVSEEPQMTRIPPVEAAYVRFVILGGGAYVQIASVNASGTLLETPKPASMTGCFAINGFPASFVQSGAEVVGQVGAGTRLAIVEGGSDGRFYRFAWVRGLEFGLAAVSITPDGEHVSGIVWHEEAIQQQQFFAADWLGDRVPCDKPAPPAISVFRTYLERFQRFPLFGLRFDETGKLHEEDSAATLSRVTAFLSANPNLPVRFVAHELQHSTPDGNRRIAQARIDSLRAALQKNGVKLANVTFVVLGEEKPRREATIDLTRAMYSSVDLELVARQSAF